MSDQSTALEQREISIHTAAIRAALAEARSPAASRSCPCFPGLCRGGDVVGGVLANGQRCRQVALLDESCDTQGGSHD